MLADKDPNSVKKIEAFAATFQAANLASAMATVDAYASARGINDTPMSASELRASRIIPIRKKPDAPGFGGGRNLGPSDAEKLTGMGLSEAKSFANGKRSVLDIRDAVSSEFGSIDIQLFLAAFEELSKSGDFELVQN